MAAMNQSMVDSSQLNLKEIIREYREEEVVKLINIITNKLLTSCDT